MSRLCVQATWDDVPHLSPDVKEQLLSSIEPHLRDARTKGIPMLGAGQIYPLPEDSVLCEPFHIPGYWPRAYALDVGWNKTAALWGAWDRNTDTVYIYAEYYVGQAVPAIHASAIQSRGDWIAGAIDPAAAGANQKDGSRLMDEYGALGLRLFPADNAVEAGIHACYQRLATGKLKVFRTCRNWLTEFRIYRRDEKGKIVKENDHLMDTMRYLIMTGMAHASIEPSELDDMEDEMWANHSRDAVTGY